jgi:hypothetical protein
METPISLETESEADDDATDAPAAGGADETEHEHEQAETEPEHDQEIDPGPPGADPTDPSVAPVGAVNEDGVEKAFTSLKNEATRHANRISAIMGEDAQLLKPCPRCVTSDPQRPATPGFIWPVEVVPLLPDDKAAVKLSIGEGVEPTYREAQDAARCGHCDGFGKVDTGSQVAKERYLSCLNCNGRGWTGSRQQAALPAQNNGVVEFEPVAVGAGESPPSADPWGRLPDDPMFGVLPGFER